MKKGQTLVIFLVFMVMAVTITSAAAAIVMTNSIGASSFEQSQIAYNVAESGIENGILRVLRNPAYTGEILSVGEGQATISVTGTNSVIITSLGRFGNYSRRLQVTAGYNGGLLQINTWQEIP
jgi:DUF971 family protein